MAQKNHKKKTTIVHHLLKKIVDFMFLWRCISKFRMNELTQMPKMNKNKKKKIAPNLMNDNSKEPQKQEDYSTSSSEKVDRF